MKNYHIFTGDGLHITHLSCKNIGFAKSYAAGIIAGWRYCPNVGRSRKGVEVLDENGTIVYKLDFNW